MSRRAVLRGAALSALGALAWPVARGGASAQPLAVRPFEQSSVRLLDGPFNTAREVNARYLRSLDPDRLLHNFRINAGLKPKAPVYGGWESVEPWIDIRCQGHTLGHYLSACAMMGDTERVEYLVSELKVCQDKRNGLICAFPDGAQPLEDSLAGKPFPGVPWYTMHKLFAGLRDARATDALARLADWTVNATRDVPSDRLQKMLDREHGGMVEVLADTCALTGDSKYLGLAERFVHRAFLDPLVARRDGLDGLHSNTQIPKAIGLARLHELTGNAQYNEAARFFWHTVTARRSFATGGNGDVEHFFPPAEFANHLQSAKTMETCCAHNMLRLTRALFTQSPLVEYADYYERALYNAILAAQDPQSGMMTYFQATRPGYVKLYCTPTDSFWCCTGSGMENPTKYADSIYFHDHEALYVNLFIASEVDWRVRVTQTTRFPEEETTRLKISAASPTRLTLKIRHPSWCPHAQVSVNGRTLRTRSRAGSYIELTRLWRDGDEVEVRLPMELGVRPLPNAPGIAALMYGPIVLAGRFGAIPQGSDMIVNERTSGEMLNIPMALPELSPERVKRAGPLSFQHGDIELIPYYRIAHERYNLYWRLTA